MRILFVILTSFLAWQGWPHLDAWLMSQGNKPLWSQEKLAQTHKRTVYILDRQQWTEFPLAPQQQSVKVLSNASIPRAVSLDRELQWHYALHYQILDNQNKLLKEHVYHHRTSVTVYQDSQTKEQIRTVFYIDPNKQPTDGRNIYINLSDISEAARLRVRLHSIDSAILDVAIRVYQRQTTDEFKLDYLWQRLNDKQKQTLARGSIYEHDLLHEQERRNLLRENYAVTGPLGIVGKGYQPKDIYIHQYVEGEIIRSQVQNYGLFIDAQHWVTIPLVESGGPIRLQFNEALPLPEQNPIQLPAIVKIKWYGHRSKERQEHTFIWDKDHKVFARDFAGGLLEIKVIAKKGITPATDRTTEPSSKVTEQPTTLRVFTKSADKVQTLQEITPAPVHLSTTLVQKDQPVEFEISHIRGQATPVRINLRRLLETSAKKGQADSKCELTYQLLDAKGRSQKTGTMSLTQPRSFYDRTKGQWWGQFEVSDADSYYLSLPAKITTLRLTSLCAVLAVVYNRPPDMLRKVRIPEDYYYNPDKSQRQPAWFRLRPQNYELLSQQNRTPLIMIQRRPPREEENVEIAAGRYTWEDYRPIGEYRSRYLLTLRDSQLPVRDKALGAFYQSISQNRPVTLHFVNSRRTIQPNLIYQRTHRKPAKIRIFLDSKLHYEGYLTGNWGELKLPKLIAKTHTLRLQVKGNPQFFINHAKPQQPGQPIYIKRLVHQFEAKGLRFEYEKRTQDKELISARVYLPKGIQERFQLQIKLSTTSKINDTHTGWTFPKRHYDLRPADEGQIIVLNTHNDFVDAGRFFVIPLQNDLPPGQYQIELMPQQSLGAYLTLSKITAGLEEQRKFFQESQPYEILF
jgi:hypothetical protein